jgi:hypothetical protein
MMDCKDTKSKARKRFRSSEYLFLLDSYEGHKTLLLGWHSELLLNAAARRVHTNDTKDQSETKSEKFVVRLKIYDGNIFKTCGHIKDACSSITISGRLTAYH